MKDGYGDGLNEYHMLNSRRASCKSLVEAHASRHPSFDSVSVAGVAVTASSNFNSKRLIEHRRRSIPPSGCEINLDAATSLAAEMSYGIPGVRQKFSIAGAHRTQSTNSLTHFRQHQRQKLPSSSASVASGALEDGGIVVCEMPQNGEVE